MSGCKLRGQSVEPLSWHLPGPVLAWSKWQCRRPGEMQVRAAVTPPVQLMATWSGQGENRRDGGEGRCLHVTQCCARWQNSPLGKGLTSQAIRGGITQPQHTEHWVMGQLERRGVGGGVRQKDCELCFPTCSKKLEIVINILNVRNWKKKFSLLDEIKVETDAQKPQFSAGDQRGCKSGINK